MEHSKYAPRNQAAAALAKERTAATDAPTTATFEPSNQQHPHEPQQQLQTAPLPPSPPPSPPAQAIPTTIPEAISTPLSPPPPGASSNGILDDLTYADLEFAQSRAPDDLFNDDFTPIAEPIVEDLTPTYSQHPQQTRQNSASGFRGAKRGRAGNGAPRQQQQPSNHQNSNNNNNNNNSTKDTDRSATGGPSKPRLTEAELSARMESVRLKNVSLEAAHARASADEARFMEREKEAAERAAAEKKTQAEMMRERERNKAWKLERGGGREWDEGKEQQLESGSGRGSGFRRGAHGGVGGSKWGGGEEAMPEGSWGDVENDAGFRGRGGRGRGRGGGRGRGRGDERGRGRGGRGRGGNNFDHAPSTKHDQAVVPDSSEFPALAPASHNENASSESKGTGAAQDPAPTPSQQTKESWAEQMDDPTVSIVAGGTKPADVEC
ncbi:MAG: hypothetical protein M1831_004086 [Alyxoria varia]|nr:MAG: hypothetical protein M1831_004086 [Alyxoria varia]